LKQKDSQWFLVRKDNTRIDDATYQAMMDLAAWGLSLQKKEKRD